MRQIQTILWSPINFAQGLSQRPEISFALSVRSRYLTKASPQHEAHAKHLLRYVWGRKHAKITWCASKVHFPFKTGQFHSYADSNWAYVLL